MNLDDFAGACTQTSLRAPATVNADGNTAGVDCLHLKGKCLVALASLNTAGSTPTLAIKLQHSPEADLIGAISYSGTGNGTLTQVEATADAVAETITLTASNATTFAVVGSVTGAMGNATVGTEFVSAQVRFLITAGSVAFTSGAAFTVAVSARVYADVPGGAFTGLTTGASQQKLQVNADQLGRFWRINHDIGGTGSPAYTYGVAVYGMTDPS
jgi:hypothetical protein